MDDVDQLIMVGLHQDMPYRKIVELFPGREYTKSPQQPGTSLRSVQRRIDRLETAGYVYPQNESRKNIPRRLTEKGARLVKSLSEAG